MKPLKILALLAVSAAALMALAGTASATELTAPAGTKLGKMAVIKMELKEGKAIFEDGTPPDVECGGSKIEGEVTNAGSATETVTLSVTALTFENCNCEVAVLAKGTLIIHTREANSNGDGTVTGNGQQITYNCGGFHCIATTNATDLGTLAGGAPAVFSVEAKVPRTGGRSGAFCGTVVNWRGVYKVTNWNELLVD